jgi:hypothetical protein
MNKHSARVTSHLVLYNVICAFVALYLWSLPTLHSTLANGLDRELRHPVSNCDKSQMYKVLTSKWRLCSSTWSNLNVTCDSRFECLFWTTSLSIQQANLGVWSRRVPNISLLASQNYHKAHIYLILTGLDQPDVWPHSDPSVWIAQDSSSGYHRLHPSSLYL